ncbi:MAG: hypothetical protein GY820_06345 [Gammaproteobacteria bacterium]|nr:hypothetical protein [Gammaproteobacteria bacterium]
MVANRANGHVTQNSATPPVASSKILARRKVVHTTFFVTLRESTSGDQKEGRRSRQKMASCHREE